MNCKIRCKLVLLLLIIYVPILLAIYFNYEKSKETVKKQIIEKNEVLAKAVDAKLTLILDNTFQTLLNLSNHPAVKQKNTKEVDRLFSETYKGLNYAANILLVDMNGQNIGSAINPEEAHKLNYSDMEWFINGTKGKPSINNPHMSKLLKIKVFMITYPVFSNNKQVAVLAIPINLNELNEKLKTFFKLPEKTNIIILNDSGVIVANLLFPQFIGKPIQRKELREAVASNLEASFIQTGIDGIERIYSLTTNKKYKWKTVIAVPYGTVFIKSFGTIASYLTLTLLLIVITFFIALYISKSLDKKFKYLISGLSKFGSGDLSHRFDVVNVKDEFYNIYQTFNLMAENVEKTEKALMKLSRIYRLLSEVNQKIVRYKDIQRLLNDTAKDIVEIGGYKTSIILEPLKKGENLFLHPVSFFGIDNLDTLNLNEPAEKHQTISKSIKNLDITLSEGNKEYPLTYKSFVSIPVNVNNEARYIILIFNDEDGFVSSELELFEELANDIAFAVKNIEISENLKEQKNLITAIFENMGEALALVDKNLKVITANKKYFEILGKNEEEVLNNYCYLKTYNKEKPCYLYDKMCPAIEVFEFGGTANEITKIKDKFGNEKILNIRFSPLKRNDKIEYVIELISDITEYEQLKSQYLHAQKLESIGRLAAGVAHDFNNILTGIIGFASLAKIERDEEKLNKNLDNILELSEKAANLTKSLLSFSRKNTPNPTNIELNDFIQNSIKMLRRVIGEDIELELIPSQKELQTFVDPIQIEQVFMNLAVNSRDAMPKGGKIKIELSETYIDENFIRYHQYGHKGRFALISFSDTGCGIPKEHLDKIFEPFFTTKEVGKGTGLGLAVVYGIIKNHDGFINVYSEEGKGTTFRIYLPIFEKLAIKRENEIVKEETSQNLGIKALLIDDDGKVLEVNHKILESFGIKVISTNSPDKAIELIEKESFDIIITDVVMPKKSGIDIYNETRKLNIKTPFLFMSGYPDEVVTERYGITLENILIKPVSPLTLISKIKEILKK